VKRFASLGVIPSIQPIHHTSDMEFLEDRIGQERVEACASPWRSFIEAGCILPCGSDFAIYSHNPLTGIHAAVTRQNADGIPEGGWQARQRMTREEALRGYTIWAARAAFQEDLVGSIEGGKLADLVVLDKDIMTIEPEEILTTKVIMTMVGGKIVYQRND
jgi:predicted amidohydrolase YtcJ